MNFNGAELIIKLLQMHGIEMVTGIPGGGNLPLYDALGKSDLLHILARHEQGAGFIAQGMSRSTGKPAICFATSGPGVTNLITAIADANMDSIPVIAITGQTARPLIGTDAFQEVDTHGLALPVTKRVFSVSSAEELLTIIPEAFEIATSGRPGPVIIDVPKDVQSERISFEKWPEINPRIYVTEIDNKKIETASEMISNSKSPLLYIGGGVNSGAYKLVKELSIKNSIPVVSTLMGLGAYDPDSDLYLGMLGMHGARSTNLIVDNSDLLIGVGVRFDDRATGRVEEFCQHASIIHIDIDSSEIDKIKKSNCGITGDGFEVLSEILPRVEENKREEWLDFIHKKRLEFPSRFKSGRDISHPAKLLQSVAEAAGDDIFVSTDVGQHQMWTAQVFPFKKPGRFLTSGGLGTMGFGLPAAIGAAFMHRDKNVICFSGDGSILMNIQELATLSEHNLNVKIVIFNNGHLGLVRQQQELFFNKNYTASSFDCRPDFVKIGRGFGVDGIVLNSCENPFTFLKECFEKEGPFIIDVRMESSENVFPMVPPGASNTTMIGELEL